MVPRYDQVALTAVPDGTRPDTNILDPVPPGTPPQRRCTWDPTAAAIPWGPALPCPDSVIIEESQPLHTLAATPLETIHLNRRARSHDHHHDPPLAPEVRRSRRNISRDRLSDSLAHAAGTSLFMVDNHPLCHLPTIPQMISDPTTPTTPWPSRFPDDHPTRRQLDQLEYVQDMDSFTDANDPNLSLWSPARIISHQTQATPRDFAFTSHGNGTTPTALGLMDMPSASSPLISSSCISPNTAFTTTLLSGGLSKSNPPTPDWLMFTKLTRIRKLRNTSLAKKFPVV